MHGAVGSARPQIAAVLAARAAIAPRVPRTVTPHVAIAITVSAVPSIRPVTIAISIAAGAAPAPAAKTIRPRLTKRRPVALHLRGSRGLACHDGFL
jgi:hypothetical protein